MYVYNYDLQVAFGVDLRNMTEVVGSQSSTLDQLMIHLKNILEGIQYSFYFFFYEVSECTAELYCLLSVCLFVNARTSIPWFSTPLYT